MYFADWWVLRGTTSLPQFSLAKLSPSLLLRKWGWWREKWGEIITRVGKLYELVLRKLKWNRHRKMANSITQNYVLVVKFQQYFFSCDIVCCWWSFWEWDIFFRLFIAYFGRMEAYSYNYALLLVLLLLLLCW